MPIQEKIGYAIILTDILLALAGIITYILLARKYIWSKDDLVEHVNQKDETELVGKMKFFLFSLITAGIILPLTVYILNTFYKDLYTMSFERFTEFLRTLLHTKIQF